MRSRSLRHVVRVLLCTSILLPGVPAALLGSAPEGVGAKGSDGLRSRVAEMTKLLPKGGPGLMGLDDASISDQAPGTQPGGAGDWQSRVIVPPSAGYEHAMAAFDESTKPALAVPAKSVGCLLLMIDAEMRSRN